MARRSSTCSTTGRPDEWDRDSDRRWAGRAAGEGRGFGLIGDLVVGIFAALIGGLLLDGSFLGEGLLGSIAVAILGAVLLLVALRVVHKTDSDSVALV